MQDSEGEQEVMLKRSYDDEEIVRTLRSHFN